MVKAAKNPDGEREALIDAVAAETVERGYANLSVERIVTRAALSTSSFDAIFPDLRTAVATAHEVLFERFVGRLVRTCKTQPSWPLKVRVAIGVTLDLAAASPMKARFLLLDSAGSDPELVRQALESRDRLVRLLATGRSEIPSSAGLPGITEQALIGGLAGTISTQLVNGEAERLPALAPQLVELTLLPYLGAEQAAVVARRPRPQVDDL
jgi:AcrR family transcriptional regulator